MRRNASAWLLVSVWLTAGACKARREEPSPAAIADRGWLAHEMVIAAGERAATCAEAGAVMQQVFAAHRQEFVDAVALDRDRKKLEQAIDYIERHQDRYADLETRMVALSERCADDPTVQAAFTAMESP